MCGFVAKRREALIALASLGTELPNSDEKVWRKWDHGRHTEKLSRPSFQTSDGSYFASQKVQ